MNKPPSGSAAGGQARATSGAPLPERLVLGLALIVPVVATLRALFASHRVQLGLLEDDAYYYLLVAENLATRGSSTFDGFTSTNGYHPLWLGVLTCLVQLCGARPSVYIPVLFGLMGLLACAFTVGLNRLLRELTPDSTFRAFTLLVVANRALPMLLKGMESVLAMPLIVASALLALRMLRGTESTTGRRHFLSLGVLTSATGLARIDAVVFGVLFAIVALWKTHTWPKRFERIALFSLGLLPLVAYFAFNQLAFGSPLTVSSEVKTLAGPGLYLAKFARLSLDRKVFFLALPLLSLPLLARGTALGRAERTLFGALYAGTGIYLATIAVGTGWNIWAWYLYPLPLCLALALALFDATLTPSLRTRISPRFLSILSLGLAAAPLLGGLISPSLKYTVDPRLEHAERLTLFTDKHPGRYAMGDRAGLTAFVIRRPVLQLEGLVADRALLEDIRRGESMRRALSRYGVSYLIESLPTVELSGACLDVESPHLRQGGASSPRLRDRFCDPLLRYDGRDEMTTLVFPGR